MIHKGLIKALHLQPGLQVSPILDLVFSHSEQWEGVPKIWSVDYIFLSILGWPGHIIPDKKRGEAGITIKVANSHSLVCLGYNHGVVKVQWRFLGKWDKNKNKSMLNICLVLRPLVAGLIFLY